MDRLEWVTESSGWCESERGTLITLVRVINRPLIGQRSKKDFAFGQRRWTWGPALETNYSFRDLEIEFRGYFAVRELLSTCPKCSCGGRFATYRAG